jgi:hypothetical protein
MERKLALAHKSVRLLETAQNYGGGRDGVLGLAPRYEPDGPGLNTEGGGIILSSGPTPMPHPTSCTMYTRYLTGIKRPERNADHPPSSSAELRLGCSYTPPRPL